MNQDNSILLDEHVSRVETASRIAASKISGKMKKTGLDERYTTECFYHDNNMYYIRIYYSIV
jgi:hypothetical protein